MSSKKAIGEGVINDISTNRSRKKGVSLIQRFKAMNSPLGSPIRISFYFHKKHYNLFKAFFFVIYLILIKILGDNLYYKLFKN